MTSFPQLLLNATYHRGWAVGSHWWYRHPSRSLVVVGVTGTKGKTTVATMLAHILSANGYSTALSCSNEFRIGSLQEQNRTGNSLPGRGFLARFLWQARLAGVTHAVIELTSQGAVQHRHVGVALDGLIFTMLEPEHIEAHGSFDAYRNAKRRLLRALDRSPKPTPFLVANAEDEEGRWWLAHTKVARAVGFFPSSTAHASARGDTFSLPQQFQWRGVTVSLPLPGAAARANALAALEAALLLGLHPRQAAHGIATLPPLAGRLEEVRCLGEAQDIRVVVDYAHTPESLRSLYEAYPPPRICVLGSCGGSRDRWKRPLLGAIAAAACKRVYLTSEDPYDEDPAVIASEIAQGMGSLSPVVELDRARAIRRAITEAPRGSSVIISGMGSAPYFYGPHGVRIPWSDRAIAEEALRTRGTMHAAWQQTHPKTS